MCCHIVCFVQYKNNVSKFLSFVEGVDRIICLEFVIFLLCLKYLTFKYVVVFTYVAFSLQLILLKLGWQMP